MSNKKKSKPDRKSLKAVLKDINEEMKVVEQEVNDALRKKREGGGEKEKPVLFKCPMPGCGNTKYIPIPGTNGVKGPNGRSWVIAYKCDGCSVLFADPVKFSKKKEKSR